MLRKGIVGVGNMPAAREAASPGWRKFGALLLGVAAVGLPVNDLGTYALLVVLTVLIFSGEVSARRRGWLAAAALVGIAVAGQLLLAAPRIEEGHNVFLPRVAVLERGLPADVYRHMEAAFDATYPASVRCKAGAAECWQNGGFPDRTYAFSADGIWRKSEASRSVTALDFSDPVWLRLGFINENRYNWGTAAPDVHRADRDRRFWMGLARWHLAMPWFEMLWLPAGLAGGELCWRGDVMWEGAASAFAALPNSGCRTIEAADAGRRVFGLAIKPDTLAMQLKPPWRVDLRLFAAGALQLGALLAIVIVLVRFRPRRTVVPFMLLGLAAIVIAIDDASFLGGVRPFDGGDDGLFYDGVGRVILRKLLAGDVYGALQGGENVFYYGGPGLRYFRALEHIVFGESYLGYLSLVLLLPFLVYFLFRRFLPQDWSLALVIVFVAIPVGTLFGTSFIDYAKWASRGFADPAAYILFVAGILPVIGATAAGPDDRFLPAFFGALLLALGIFMKPIVAPAAAVSGRLFRSCRAEYPAVPAPRRALSGLVARVPDGLAQLGLRPCFRAVQCQFGQSAGAGDAAIRLCASIAPTLQPRSHRRQKHIDPTGELALGPGQILRHRAAERRRFCHSRLCRCPRPKIRSLAAAPRRRGAGAACGGAVLYGQHRPLSFSCLAAHFCRGHGLVSPDRNGLAAAALSGIV